MFAAPLDFHPHYLHAGFYVRSERKTELALRANKNKTKLRLKLVSVMMNLTKASVLHVTML